MHAPSSTPRSLLVIDDESEIREALSDALTLEGFSVTGCANGREALEWLRRSPKPDLILLDLVMPIMDGWQFRVAQKQDPELATIPVLAFSANSTAKAAAIDAEEYLGKPVDYDTLIETVERLLLAGERREFQARMAQTDRLTSLGTLAAGVAHEINNPLAYVLLNLGFVRSELESLLSVGKSTEHRSKEVLQAFDQAISGAERIRDIVRGLKTFSRPEDTSRAPVDVERVMEATLAMIANEIRHRAKLNKVYGAVSTVMANEAQLGQVFLNLVLNAVQALPEDHGQDNEIDLRVESPSKDRVVITVRDNGVGIPQQVRGRIFEPFFTTKPVGVGTGLGLAICHGIVASFGGTLSFESETGKGTTFRVDLPAVAKASRERASVRPAASGVHQAASARAGRILVVDDEPMVGTSLERLLASEGEVVVTTSGGAALAHLEAGERFDVILCDLMMPEMDGPTLYARLCEIARDQAERMVFISGGAFTHRANEFLESVPNQRINKPFEIDALVSVVREKMGVYCASEQCTSSSPPAQTSRSYEEPPLRSPSSAARRS